MRVPLDVYLPHIKFIPTPYKSPYTQALYVPLSTLTIQASRQQKIRIPNLLIAYVPICARTIRSQLVDGTLTHLPTPPQSSDSGVTHSSYIVLQDARYIKAFSAMNDK